MKEISELNTCATTDTTGSDRSDMISLEARLTYTPDWRWVQAGEVCQGRVKSQDPLVKEAAAYLKVRHGPKAREKYRRLALLESMYATGDPRATRWFLEALLIAGAADDEISGYLALPSWSISMYHDLFYDVRPYRDHEGMLIARALQRMTGFADYDTVWKRIGLFCGPDALRAYWGGAGSDAAGAQLDRRLADALRRAAVNASERRSQYVEPHAEGEVIEQYLAKAAADRDSIGVPQAGVLSALELRIVPKTTQAVEGLSIPEVSLVRRLQGAVPEGSEASSHGARGVGRDSRGLDGAGTQ